MKRPKCGPLKVSGRCQLCGERIDELHSPSTGKLASFAPVAARCAATRRRSRPPLELGAFQPGYNPKLLDGGAENHMPRQRWQDPKIQTRSDVSRPFFFIRPFVPMVTSEGIVRKQKSVPLGFCDELSKRQAFAKKQEVMASVNSQRFIVECQIPFGEIVRKFRDARVPQLGFATQTKYRLHIENHILPAFATTRMCDIDRPSIEAWLNEKARPRQVAGSDGTVHEKPGLGWWARQDLRNIMSAIFTKATEWKLWQGGNPCAGIQIGRRKEKREKRLLQDEDLARFLAALPDTHVCTAEAARLVVLIAVVAGLRVSEVLGLKPKDLDFSHATLTVNRRWHRGHLDTPKSENAKRMRQIGGLADDLNCFCKGRGPEEFIFGREDGNPPDDRDLQKHVFRPTAEALGVYFEGFGMHTFRRQNVSWRQEAGATPFEAMKAAGHARPSTTWLYTITDSDREREQVGRILERVEKATSHQHGLPQTSTKPARVKSA